MRKSRKDKGKSREKYSSVRRPINKIKKCISLDKGLWPSIDILARERRQTRSELINEILKTILGSTKSMLIYELKEKGKQLNYAKFQAANYNSEEEIDKAIKELKAGR
ncbi:MAG TPA: hypothetical protein ENH99_01640 [Candidatus Pacearchaeota archaeon]|uniref:Uncharacterized protein n=1 Tax=marine sediment metagenome TaxID=412755 RepID=A0A0F9KJ51_9ZZZZ|nr:hypothetical protein [Candidatus Pacearchaeota archaeon]